MIQIVLDNAAGAFEQGATIRGQVAWSEFNRLESLEIRLIWFTRGKGDRDVQIVQQQTIRSNASSGSEPFEFTAPRAPYSFSGKLISIIWAVEVVAFPSRNAESVEIVIAPGANEVVALG